MYPFDVNYYENLNSHPPPTSTTILSPSGGHDFLRAATSISRLPLLSLLTKSKREYSSYHPSSRRIRGSTIMTCKHDSGTTFSDFKQLKCSAE